MWLDPSSGKFIFQEKNDPALKEGVVYRLFKKLSPDLWAIYISSFLGKVVEKEIGLNFQQDWKKCII